VIAAIAALEMCLAGMGYPVEPGAGVRAAEKILGEAS